MLSAFRDPHESEESNAISGHWGADYFPTHFFLQAILDRPGKEYVTDVYQAMDMTLPGTLGYRSIWEGNIPLEVPDFRKPEDRERYRGDNWCVDPKMAGPGQPEHSSSFGPVGVPDSIFEEQARLYRKSIGIEE